MSSHNTSHATETEASDKSIRATVPEPKLSIVFGIIIGIILLIITFVVVKNLYKNRPQEYFLTKIGYGGYLEIEVRPNHTPYKIFLTPSRDFHQIWSEDELEVITLSKSKSETRRIRGRSIVNGSSFSSHADFNAILLKNETNHSITFKISKCRSLEDSIPNFGIKN